MENKKQTTTLAFAFGGMLLSVVTLAIYWVLSGLFSAAFGTTLSAAMSITTSLIAVLLCAASIPMLLAGLANFFFTFNKWVKALIHLGGGLAAAVLYFVCFSLFRFFPETIGVPADVSPLVLAFGPQSLLFCAVALLLIYVFVQLCNAAPATVPMKGAAFGIFAAMQIVTEILMSMLFVFLLRNPQLHAMGAAVGGVLGFLTGTAVLVMASIARKKEQTAKTVHETVKDEPIE
ncbi:MAG: hypothetical protein IKU17_05065 [Clostridia bacterium]|nr:hypothetical protein [Clostridia bacterium]